MDGDERSDGCESKVISCEVVVSLVMKEKNPWLLMDHDGTLTDSDLEAREYREIVLDYMSS